MLVLASLAGGSVDPYRPNIRTTPQDPRGPRHRSPTSCLGLPPAWQSRRGPSLKPQVPSDASALPDKPLTILSHSPCLPLLPPTGVKKYCTIHNQAVCRPKVLQRRWQRVCWSRRPLHCCHCLSLCLCKTIPSAWLLLGQHRQSMLQATVSCLPTFFLATPRCEGRQATAAKGVCITV